jgi:hypothetical protein
MKSQHPGLSGPSRRAFLGGSAALGAALTLPAWPVRANPALRRDPRSFRVSLSVSPFTEAVLGSLALTDGRHTASTVRQVQQLFNLHGATEVFARVATRRNASSGDAEYGMVRAIERAQLARDLGMPLNPELGLWPVYGDIGGQPPPDFSDHPSINLPGTWTSLALPQMEAALRQYGVLAAQQILATGVRVNYWDLGNEVDWGVAGVAVRGFNASNYIPPDAVDPAIGQMTAAQLLGMTEPDRISWLQQHMWPYVGRLLAATGDGVRSTDPAARSSTHIADIEITSPATPVAFWTAMHQAGYVPDQFGTSFYPTAPGTGDRRAVLLQTAAALQQTFGRQLFLAEYAYPSGKMTGRYPWNNTQAGYLKNPGGQFRYLRDLTAMAAQAGTIAGIRSWAPDYCLASGGWQPMSLFTGGGIAEPALTSIQAGPQPFQRRRPEGSIPRR